MSTGSSKTEVVVLVGPTASGKTKLLDQSFGRGFESTSTQSAPGTPLISEDSVPPAIPGIEIISADSMQAYRGLDIGTAKPETPLREAVPHHLIDILDPEAQYTAGDFARLAESACESIASRGCLPVVSGGTGFYVRTFLCGAPTAPPADPAIRAQVAADLERCGEAVLRQELERGDPASAARIHPNDLYRLTRAIEILRATGLPLATFAARTEPEDSSRFLVLGICPPKDELGPRIDTRVDAMFDTGLATEVARLIGAGYGPDTPAMRAIGYREFFDPQTGRAFDISSPQMLDSIRARIKLDTRQYAKRQMTYFRALPGIRWIEADPGILRREVAAFLFARRREPR